MATPNGYDEKFEERKKQVVLELPNDFLRIEPTAQQQQEAADEQTAIALQHQMSGSTFVPPNVTGRLSISVIEAKLNKSYGLTRMDPYVRLRIGHAVYETHTHYNGAKNPHWNKVFHSFVMPGVAAFTIDVYDERTLTLDEKIAWGHYEIPENVLKGETLDDWFPLTGKLGDAKEGLINLVLSYTPIPTGTVMYPQTQNQNPQQPVMVVPAPYYNMVPYPPTGVVYSPTSNNQLPPGTQPPPQQPQLPQAPQPVVQITDDDVKQVHEMFPTLDEEVVRTVLESHRGNKDRTINALLTMTSES